MRLYHIIYIQQCSYHSCYNNHSTRIYKRLITWHTNSNSRGPPLTATKSSSCLASIKMFQTLGFHKAVSVHRMSMSVNSQTTFMSSEVLFDWFNCTTWEICASYNIGSVSEKVMVIIHNIQVQLNYACLYDEVSQGRVCYSEEFLETIFQTPSLKNTP